MSLLASLWCAMFHQPRHGWCRWTGPDGEHARCICPKCGKPYPLRIALVGESRE